MPSQRVLAFFWILVLFLAQNSLTYVFPEKAPALVLIGVLYYALAEGRTFGALIGIWGGLCIDLFGLGRPGFSMAAFAAAGFSCGFISSKIFQDSLPAEFALPVLSLYLIQLAELALLHAGSGEPLTAAMLGEALLLWPLLTTLAVSPWLFGKLRRVAPPKRRRWAPLGT